jgi:hypothetical protein
MYHYNHRTVATMMVVDHDGGVQYHHGAFRRTHSVVSGVCVVAGMLGRLEIESFVTALCGSQPTGCF